MNRRGSKPRLASNEVIEITNPAAVSANLDSASSSIELPPTFGDRLSNVVRAFIGIGVIVTVISAIAYLALSATVLIVAKPFDYNAVVLRGVYPQGQVPTGAIMLVSADPAAKSTVDKLSEGTLGVDAAAVVTIVAGPAAHIYNDETGQIIADDKPTKYWAPVDNRNLTRQYVAICIKGACTPGETVLVGQDTLIGEVKGYITGIGPLTKPSTPKSALIPPAVITK